MFKYIVPSFEKGLLIEMLKISFISSLFAGLYGILHDQVTFTISNEYFLKLKYQQFHYISFNGNERIKVSMIGFLATWWVGLFLGWFLARWFLPNCSFAIANKKIIKSVLIIFIVSVSSAIAGGGFLFSKRDTMDYSSWLGITNTYGIENIWAFVNVAYIHNCSYLGAFLGLVIALVLVKRESDF